MECYDDIVTFLFCCCFYYWLFVFISVPFNFHAVICVDD